MKCIAKIFLIVLLFISISIPLFALNYQLGIKGGINFSSFTGQGGGDIKTGYNFGVFGTFFIIDTIAIQPEVLFTVKGDKEQGVQGLESVHNNLYYLEIPLLFKYYKPVYRYETGPNFYAGPYLGINLWNTSVAKDVFKSYQENRGEATKIEYPYVNSLDFGITIGFGIDFYRTLLDFRFSLGLITTDNSIYNWQLQNQVMMISGGIILKLKS